MSRAQSSTPCKRKARWASLCQLWSLSSYGKFISEDFTKEREQKNPQDGELVRNQDREKDVPRKGWVRPFA